MAKRVILIRHGNVEEAFSGRYIGSTDLPLSEHGKRQAAAIAGALGSLHDVHILSSPLLRSRQTAEIALGSAIAFDIEPDLREIDFGLWEGLGFDEIAAADPAGVARWAALEEGFAFPGGEGLWSFGKRIGAVAERIASDSAGSVIAFAHGGVIRSLICRYLGLEDRHFLLFEVRHGSLSEVSLDGVMGVLVRLNDRCHLKEE